MSDTKIIGLGGETLTETEHGYKREHDPERVNGMRGRLNNLMVQMQRGWAQDMFADPTGATQPDALAVRKHWGEKWQAQAVAVLNSSDPVNVDPLALFTWIDRELAAKERKEQLQKPLHQLHDLEPHGFRLLGAYNGDPLWVSSECAVLLCAGGTVRVHIRSVADWLDGWVLNLPYIVRGGPAFLALPDYTLGELETLMGCLRRERMAHPPEELMSAAREALAKLTQP